MSSIDEAAGAVRGNAEQARELAGGIAASKQTIDELTAQTSAFGLESKASQAQAASGRAEELANQANALTDGLDALRAEIEAMRGLLAGATGSGAGVTGQPHHAHPHRPIPTARSQRRRRPKVRQQRPCRPVSANATCSSRSE